MNYFEVIISILLILNLLFSFLIFFNFKNFFLKNKILESQNEKDIQEKPDEVSQVYFHKHLDHLLNVEIEKAERYQFGFTFMVIDYSRLLEDSVNKKEVELVLISIMKRTLRIVDFIVAGNSKGQVNILITEADEKSTHTVVSRIKKNLAQSVLDKNTSKIRIAYATYPADATTKDLLFEYVYSALMKTSDKEPVKSYGQSLE
ncbi:MAG: hypothetical protein ACQESP_04345 [Candidatus Muiribacteriota bacterium]